MAKWFRGLFVPPAFPDDDEKTRKSALLYSILLIMLAVSATYTVSVPFTQDEAKDLMLIGIIAMCICLVGLALIRAGHITRTAVGFTIFTWLVFTLVAILGSGMKSPVIMTYFLIIVIAGLAVSNKAGIFVSALSILSLIGMLVCEAYNILPIAYLNSSPASDSIVLALTFASATGILLLVNRSINQGLEEREKTARSLNERSNTLSALLDALPDLIFRIDTNGIFTDYIPSKEIKTLLPLEQFLGKSLEEILPAHLAEETREHLKKTLTTNQTQTFEYTLEDEYFEARMTPDQTGNAVIVVRDITARVQAQTEREHLLAALKRGNAQLQTASEVSKSCSGIFDPQTLIEKAVNLIQKGLEVYYVGIFLVDEEKQRAVLNAGSGKAGEKMVKAGYFLPLKGQSMIAWCIKHNRARIAQQTTLDRVWLQNPYLPETRSELALPLTSRDQVIGALTVQSSTENAFTENDIAVLQSMAEQLAITIDNADLFTELQHELAERKRVEAALRSSEEKFLRIFKSSPVTITIRDLDGRYINVNDTFTKVTGYSSEEILGKSIQEVGYILNYDEWANAQRKLEQVGSFADLVVEVQRKDGERIHVLMNSELTMLDDKPYVLTTAMDITERRRSEEALRASEEKFSKAFHASPNAAFILRASDHKYLEVNEAFFTLTGFERDEMLGSTAFKYNIFGGSGIPEAVIDKISSEGQVRNFEFTFIKKCGQTGIGLLSIDEIVVNHDPCYLVLIQDITQQKLAAQERDALIQELSAKNAELERFTYTVSHDLKSPLVTIRGFAGYLEQDMNAGDTERTKSDIKRITGAAEKMQRLLDELLELSRIGRLINPPQEVPYEEIVREAISLVEGQIKHSGVAINIDPNMPSVLGDKVRLVEVVQNLLDNAVKFMGDQKKPLIEIGSFTSPDQEPIFFIKDNGAGIPPAYQDRVFRLFDKLDPNTDGTGVGLALVKRIIEVHGGTIWLESEGEGHGTTFFFKLPKYKDATPSTL